jgi:hypothetical protein
MYSWRCNSRWCRIGSRFSEHGKNFFLLDIEVRSMLYLSFGVIKTPVSHRYVGNEWPQKGKRANFQTKENVGRLSKKFRCPSKLSPTC